MFKLSEFLKNFIKEKINNERLIPVYAVGAGGCHGCSGCDSCDGCTGCDGSKE